MNPTEFEDAMAELEKYQRAIAKQMMGVKQPPKKGPNMVAPSPTTQGSAIPPEFQHIAKQGRRLVWAERLENTTSRNAEYTVGVLEQPVGTSVQYEVIRLYGAMGAAQNRSVHSTHPDMYGAISAAKKQIASKTSGDYVHVSAYDGTNENLDPADYEEALDEPTLAEPEKIVPEPEVILPSRDCNCFARTEEIACTVWADPEPLTPDLAPLILQPAFGMRELPLEVGARWVVGFDATCSPGYDHVRAYPVGPAMDDDETPRDQRRNRAKWVEEVVSKNLMSEYGRANPNAAFALVVEEQTLDIVVIDVLMWDGVDGSDASFTDRWSLLTKNWGRMFPSGFGFKYADLHFSRLRDIYLGIGDQYRFELVDMGKPAPTPSWVLPVLEPLPEE